MSSNIIIIPHQHQCKELTIGCFPKNSYCILIFDYCLCSLGEALCWLKQKELLTQSSAGRFPTKYNPICGVDCRAVQCEKNTGNKAVTFKLKFLPVEHKSYNKDFKISSTFLILPPPLKFIWKFFVKLVLPRKRPFNFTLSFPLKCKTSKSCLDKSDNLFFWSWWTQVQIPPQALFI